MDDVRAPKIEVTDTVGDLSRLVVAARVLVETGFVGLEAQRQLVVALEKLKTFKA